MVVRITRRARPHASRDTPHTWRLKLLRYLDLHFAVSVTSRLHCSVSAPSSTVRPGATTASQTFLLRFLTAEHELTRPNILLPFSPGIYMCIYFLPAVTSLCVFWTYSCSHFYKLLLSRYRDKLSRARLFHGCLLNRRLFARYSASLVSRVIFALLSRRRSTSSCNSTAFYRFYLCRPPQGYIPVYTRTFSFFFNYGCSNRKEN